MRKLLLGLSIVSLTVSGVMAGSTVAQVPDEPVDLPDLICVYEKEPPHRLLYCIEV